METIGCEKDVNEESSTLAPRHPGGNFSSLSPCENAGLMWSDFIICKEKPKIGALSLKSPDF